MVLELLIPMLMSTIVDGGLYRESTFMLQGLFSPELIANRNRFVLTVGAIMVGVACLSMAMGVLAARCSAIATQGFARNMRSTLLGKIESFSFSNIDHISTPQLITRATTDINTLRDTMRQSLVTLYRAPVMVILATVMSFIVSPGLAPLLLICIPLLVVLMVILLKVGQPRFKRMLKMMDGMNQAVRENLVASRVVKAFVRGGYESKRFDKTTDDLRQAQLGAGRLFTLSGPITMGIMWTCSVLILFFGGREIIFRTTGLLTGQLVSLVNYAGMAVNSLSMISWLVMSLSRAQASLVRINEVLDTKPHVVPGAKTEGSGTGSVEFRDVSFRYPGAAADELEHISFKVEKGQTLAIIGATGSGKTTLASLIPRFYDATAGTVLVDGLDVREYTFDALYNKLGYVTQKAVLFAGTVEDNVFFGQSAAEKTDASLQAALSLSQAAEFVDKYPEKAAHPIAQLGRNVSGGQKQRLSIARALARTPEILIFDDSFSALDYKTDAVLREGLAKELPGTTKIIVAQRISTIRNADQILVLDRGEIAGLGTHDALMASCTVYREIAMSQLSEEELKKGGASK